MSSTDFDNFRHEVYKFGLSGFERKDQLDARAELAIKLGAKPKKWLKINKSGPPNQATPSAPNETPLRKNSKAKKGKNKRPNENTRKPNKHAQANAPSSARSSKKGNPKGTIKSNKK